MTKMIKVFSLCGLAAFGVACGDGVLFDEDFKSNFIKVSTTCEQSPTHGNDHMQIWVSSQEVADLIAAFADGSNAAPDYPVDATLIKEQYAGDDTCTTVTGWTVSQKITAGRNDDGSHWAYQRVGADRSVTEWAGCIDCHRGYKAGDFVAYSP